MAALCAMAWGLETNAAHAQAVTKISAAKSYELITAPLFETQFSNMAGFNSPTVSGTAPDGMFVFKAKSASLPGGRIQITFRGVKAAFSGKCVVGNTGQTFEIKLRDTVGGTPKDLSATSSRVGTEAVFTFSGDPMRAQGDYVIIITSESWNQDWNLYRCEISTGASASRTPSPPTSPTVN